jgi:DNA-binding MarR family transcriptional regulator
MADYHTAHRRWPSQREIARAMGVQSSNMSGYLRQLVDKRLVRKTRAKHRNAAITTTGWEAIRTQEPPHRQSS